MSKALFIFCRTSGRIIQVNGDGQDWAAFTFLPSFSSLRLARVRFDGLTHPGQLHQLCTWHGADIIQAGVMKSLGMNCECRYTLNHILTEARLPKSVRVTAEA